MTRQDLYSVALELDITSVEAPVKLTRALERADVRIGLVHLHGPPHDLAQRAGLLDHISPDRIHHTMAAAVSWAQTTSPARPRREPSRR